MYIMHGNCLILSLPSPPSAPSPFFPLLIKPLQTFSIHFSPLLYIVSNCYDCKGPGRFRLLQITFQTSSAGGNVCLLFAVIGLVGQMHTNHDQVIYSLL